MSTETHFTELTNQFKKEAHRILEESISTIQGDYLPYLESDTQANVEYRTLDAIEKLISGNFTTNEVGDTLMIKVSDHITISLDSEPWNKAVDVLAAKFGDTAKDMKIARLERELKESYHRI